MLTAEANKRVAVTGGKGFIGTNLRWFLRQNGFDAISIGHEEEVGSIMGKLAGVSLVFHLAGVNRSEKPEAFQAGNFGMTERLIQAMRAVKVPPAVAYSSSTQAELDNPYGASKARAEEVLRAYARESGADVHLLRLPNVFGKWSRPNYNSAVATFCYNVARGLPIQINDPTRELTLIYIDDLCEFLVGLAKDGRAQNSTKAIPTHKATVGEVAGMIQSFARAVAGLELPQAGNGLQRALYATYVSFLPAESFNYGLEIHRDTRGEFAEFVHSGNRGQISYFTANPGVTRGEHYHHSKVERFLVISGTALFRYRQIETGEIYEVEVTGGAGKVVETIPGWTHNIKNIGTDTMIVVLWANEIFDPSRPDTYGMRVDS